MTNLQDLEELFDILKNLGIILVIMSSNGASGGGGRDEKTPEEKHRAHVAEMDRLRAREEVCNLKLLFFSKF